MKNEIIKKNLIITILSLLLFFTLSIFATSYSIRNSFEKEVVSVSQMIENQLEDETEERQTKKDEDKDKKTQEEDKDKKDENKQEVITMHKYSVNEYGMVLNLSTKTMYRLKTDTYTETTLVCDYNSQFEKIYIFS